MKNNKRDTKEEILLTSERLFSSFSFNSVSMREIADELDISKAALYYHFDSKEDIAMKIMKNFQAKMIFELKTVDELEIDSVDKIKELVKVYFSFLKKGKCLFFFLRQSSFRDLKSLSDIRDDIKGDINEAIYPIIEKALKDRSEVDIKLAVNFFLGILMSAAVDEIMNLDKKNKNISNKNKKNTVKSNKKIEEFSDQIILFMGL